MRIVLIALFLILSSAAPSQTTTCVASHYRIVAIGIVPSAINDEGLIAGSSTNRKAAFWSESTGMKEVPLPPGFRSAEATALNNKGDLAGAVGDTASGKRRAFLYRGGKTTLLPGVQGKATAMNDAGAIAGEAALGGKQISAAVLWRNESPASLGGCCGGTVTALNNRGEAAGQVYDERGNYTAFRWDAGRGMERIGPPDVYSSAVTMNNKGHILIQEYAKQAVYLYSEGKLKPITLSPKFASRLRGINDCDAVVGSYGPFADADHAFIWDPTAGFRDLNDLIDASSGWKLEAATGINNRGEVVGWGDFKHEENQWFLLIPVQ